jgi:tetratricopeptide (TPR) repeat protein
MRDEHGVDVIVPLTSLQSSRVEMLAGDLPVAEHDLRGDLEKLSAMGDRYLLPLVAALLALAVCRQSRYNEAAELATSAGQLVDDDDVETNALLRCVQARVRADRRDFVSADRLAREAVEMLEQIESPDLRGDCLVTLADILLAADRREDARTALSDAQALYIVKEPRGRGSSPLHAQRTQGRILV